MDRYLALEFVRVTEAAAIAAASWIGKGDKNAADGAAVDEMRNRFNQIDFRGRIVIGEGTKDEAPRLYTGEKIGNGTGPEMDIAVDPLECTNSVAFGRYNAMSVAVAGPKSSLLSPPDTEDYFYMQKIAVGPQGAKVIDLKASVAVNIKKTAKALGKSVQDVTVVILDRPRHEELIHEVRAANARVRLITDGDVAGAIATCLPETGIDLLMGIGGGPEGVLAAAAIKAFGGQLLGRFCQKDGTKPQKVLSADDMAKGKQLTFTATGVIDGPLLQGVRMLDHTIITHSLVIRGQSGTLRYITTHHHANK